MVLLLKTARDHWRSYLIWTLGLVAMVGIQLSVYPTIRSSAAGLATFLDNYPEALKQIFRMEDYTSGAGFLSTELFSMMLPLIFISIGASWGANATAQEEERRTADILLTLPISRERILGIKITTAILAQVLLAVVTVLSLVIGIRFVDLSLGTSKIIAGALTGTLLGILFNSVATFMGAAWGKRSVALGGAIGLAIAGFLFFSLAPLVDTFERITPINPFQWTLGSRPLYDGIDVGYTAFSLVFSLVLYVASLFVFRRRDIQA
ncbi:MAG TPA: ABC transporter permease subunit [Candidatus Nanopelagicaceae bacterium]